MHRNKVTPGSGVIDLSTCLLGSVGLELRATNSEAVTVSDRFEGQLWFIPISACLEGIAEVSAAATVESVNVGALL